MPNPASSMPHGTPSTSNEDPGWQIQIDMIQNQLAHLIHGQERIEKALETSNAVGSKVFNSDGFKKGHKEAHTLPLNGDSMDIPEPDRDLALTQALEQNDAVSPEAARKIVKDRKGKAMTLYRVAELREIFDQYAEGYRRKSERKLLAKDRRSKGTIHYIRSMPLSQYEMLLDTMMSVVISSNAIFIGLSLDHQPDGMSGWKVVDVMFTVIFFTELCLKFDLHGIRGHFCGKDKCSNIFDFFLIITDATQMILSFVSESITESMNDAGVPSASLFRIIRLARLTRILRILRNEIFRDLLLMLQGMAGGLMTLAWAVIIYIIMVYVLALCCVEFFGFDDHRVVKEVNPYFDTVARSMFTVFRCSFGDCSNSAGVPIPEYISEYYGGLFALGYCVFVFFVSIGLFNVISAIFVDSTMSATTKIDAAKRQERLDDKQLWAGSVAGIILELLQQNPTTSHMLGKNGVLKDVDELLEVEFSRKTIDEAIRDNYGNNIIVTRLNDLDIDSHDHNRLSDILDPDHSGAIGVLELVNGIKRLRGEPRRSDVVTIDLMIRSLQDLVEEVKESVETVSGARVMPKELSPHRPTWLNET